jgi:hypothetical protein
VTRVAEYIGLSRTEEELKEISEMLKFDSMKDIQSLNNSAMEKIGFIKTKFMRKGILYSYSGRPEKTSLKLRT